MTDERRDVDSGIKNQTRADPMVTQFLQSSAAISTGRNSARLMSYWGKEEILAHKREAVIDDTVLPCHRVHRRPQEYAASLGCGNPMTSIHLMMANNAGACDRLDYGLSCGALRSTWLLPSSHESLIWSCALVINLYRTDSQCEHGDVCAVLLVWIWCLKRQKDYVTFTCERIS